MNALVLAYEPSEEFRNSATAADISLISPKSEVPGVAVVRKALWPQIRSAGSDGGLSSGPTGNPWVDSNGWLARLTAAQEATDAVWLNFSPPSNRVLGPADFKLAVADAAAVGSRWSIDLGKSVAEGVATGNADAKACWQGVVAALQFFGRGDIRQDWSTPAKLGIVFSSASEYRPAFGREVLNLTIRRHLPYHVLPEERFAKASLSGLTTLLAVGTKPPQGEVRERLLGFAREGGLSIVPIGTTAGLAGLERLQQNQPRYTRYRIGKGQLAESTENWDDPYKTAADVQLLISRRQDVLRLWNAGAMIANYLVSPDGRKGELRLLNYTTRPFGDPVSVQFMRTFRAARLVTMENAEPQPLPIHQRGDTIEIPLPPFAVYADVELDA